MKDAVTEGERQIIGFLSGIAPDKTKALRRKHAIVAFASMVGGMTLARITSDGELRREILKDVAHAASTASVQLSEIDAEFLASSSAQRECLRHCIPGA